MGILESIKIAISSLRSHKMRSLLTMLGIIIGVSSVIVVVAIGQGGEKMLKSQIVGTDNTLEVYYIPDENEIQEDSNALTSAFTPEDIRVIESIREVKTVVATSNTNENIRHKKNTLDSNIIGINQSYLEVNALDIDAGRKLLAADFVEGARVAVVSSSFQNELLPEGSLINEVITIQGYPFEIVGVFEKPDGIFTLGGNEVYIPWNTWKYTFHNEAISQVTIEANNVEDLQVAGMKTTKLLNDINDKDESYQVLNLDDIAEGIGIITRIMTVIISSVAGISLFVGGIGVMNIMLVSVTERSREIGIRMALGATRRQILVQFLIESLTLTLIGGVIGMALGVGLVNTISLIAGWPSYISIQVIFIGMLLSLVIGVVFGLLPANKAAKLDPIHSLRNE